MNQMKYPSCVMLAEVTGQGNYIDNDGVEKLILSFRPSHGWYVPEGKDVSEGKWREVPVPVDESRDPSVWLSAGGTSAKAAKFQARQRYILGYKQSWAVTAETWEIGTLIGKQVHIFNKENEYNGVTKDSFSIVEGVEPPTRKVNPQKESQHAVLADAAMMELEAEAALSKPPVVDMTPAPGAVAAAEPVAAVMSEAGALPGGEGSPF